MKRVPWTVVKSDFSINLPKATPVKNTVKTTITSGPMSQIIEVAQWFSGWHCLFKAKLSWVSTGAFFGVCLFPYVAFDQVFQFPPVQRHIRWIGLERNFPIACKAMLQIYFNWINQSHILAKNNLFLQRWCLYGLMVLNEAISICISHLRWLFFSTLSCGQVVKCVH